MVLFNWKKMNNGIEIRRKGCRSLGKSMEEPSGGPGAAGAGRGQ